MISSPEQPLIVVSGLSGAGMSTVLKDLEDLGYEAFDNLPPTLIGPLLTEAAVGKPIAIAIDIRSRSFSADAVLKIVADRKARLVFITADEAVLQRRFTETRRRHPLAQDRPVIAGIRREMELLHPLRAAADLVIDTSDFSVHDLKRIVGHHFSLGAQRGLAVTIMSFGFRYGVPREADIVMDIRFLKNPHWSTGLRPLTGLDQAVGEFILRDNNFSPFLQSFQGLVGPLLPLYAREGKKLSHRRHWLHGRAAPIGLYGRDAEKMAGRAGRGRECGAPGCRPAGVG